jgi:choline dehydrogenase
MVYVRGHGYDQNRWAKECGDENWDYDHVLPYFKRAQKFHGDQNPYRGNNGPLSVSEGDYHTPLYQAFVDAGIQAGYPPSDDLNGYQQEGFGRLPMTVNPDKGMFFSYSKLYSKFASIYSRVQSSKYYGI